jgi:hypothetical protein
LSIFKFELAAGLKWTVSAVGDKELNPKSDEMKQVKNLIAKEKNEIADALKFLAKDVIYINKNYRKMSGKMTLLTGQTVSMATGHYFQ